MDQMDLFDMPAMQVDATHWNIYEGDKLIGTYELDRIGFDFKSCVGPMCGGGGPLDEGENIERSLNHAIKVLKHHYKQTKEHVEEEADMNYIEVKVEVEKCEWSREMDDVWRSDCGLLWEFDNEETPKANNMNYCPKCGKILKEAPECWEEDEDE